MWYLNWKKSGAGKRFVWQRRGICLSSWKEVGFDMNTVHTVDDIRKSSKHEIHSRTRHALISFIIVDGQVCMKRIIQSQWSPISIKDTHIQPSICKVNSCCCFSWWLHAPVSLLAGVSTQISSFFYSIWAYLKWSSLCVLFTRFTPFHL